MDGEWVVANQGNRLLTIALRPVFSSANQFIMVCIAQSESSIYAGYKRDFLDSGLLNMGPVQRKRRKRKRNGHVPYSILDERNHVRVDDSGGPDRSNSQP